ncbi:hypothetical protein Hamer_G008468 [Homarus americanus]|uniref:Uncharacterized protein n=1 Tax=Homarus americanus TaxID=6706 RepID=A0A8J5TJ52_HOMAM|nr:hypothetical protein Hamer_G008468 [Homarus americanus]
MAGTSDAGMALKVSNNSYKAGQIGHVYATGTEDGHENPYSYEGDIRLLTKNAKIVLPIVSVKIRGKDSHQRNHIRTLALLDLGSDRSYCIKDLAQKLRVKETPTLVTMGTFGKKRYTSQRK